MDGEGGFLAPGGKSGFSPTGETPRKGKGRNQPLVPLTIKQILAASQSGDEDEFTLDGRNFAQVTLVGQILSITQNPAFYNYTLDDGTGQIDVRCWIDQEDPTNPQTQRLAVLEQGMYVRVVGSLRAFGERKNVVAFRLIALLDFNELTFHFLEVIYHKLNATRGQISHGSWAEPARTGDYKPAAQPAVNPYLRAMPAMDAGMNTLQQEILRYLRTNTSPDDPAGVSFDTVSRTLAGVANPDQVRKEIARLQDDGHIYTTIDDDHFAYTGD